MISAQQKKNLLIACHAYDCGINYAAELYGVSKAKVYYWLRYLKNNTIPNKHGGSKNFTFSPEQR